MATRKNARTTVMQVNAAYADVQAMLDTVAARMLEGKQGEASEAAFQAWRLAGTLYCQLADWDGKPPRGRRPRNRPANVLSFQRRAA